LFHEFTHATGQAERLAQAAGINQEYLVQALSQAASEVEELME